jgi:hypothetical protein
MDNKISLHYSLMFIVVWKEEIQNGIIMEIG